MDFENLLSLLSDPPQAHALASLVIDHFKRHGQAEPHSTRTNGGDLRVRMNHGRRFKGGHGRNIFTMYWQPRKNTFLCKIELPSGLLPASSAFMNVRETGHSERLDSQFDCRPGVADADLIKAIEMAIQRFIQLN